MSLSLLAHRAKVNLASKAESSLATRGAYTFLVVSLRCYRSAMFPFVLRDMIRLIVHCKGISWIRNFIRIPRQEMSIAPCGELAEKSEVGQVILFALIPFRRRKSLTKPPQIIISNSFHGNKCLRARRNIWLSSISFVSLSDVGWLPPFNERENISKIEQQQQSKSVRIVTFVLRQSRESKEVKDGSRAQQQRIDRRSSSDDCEFLFVPQ